MKHTRQTVANLRLALLLPLQTKIFEKFAKTRKSTCVNGRDTPPAAYQVLTLLICLLTGGGDPIQDWMGVLDGRYAGVDPGWGTSSPSAGWGAPSPSAGWGTPCPDLGQGTPHLDLGWGTPPPDLGQGTHHHQDGVTPIQTWDGIPPPCQQDEVPPPRPRLGSGNPLLSRMGYCPPVQTWDWVSLPPPPAPPQVGTDWKYYLTASEGGNNMLTPRVDTWHGESWIRPRQTAAADPEH